MKARHIRKLRQQLEYYNVWVTDSHCLFGVSDSGNPKCMLLARNPKEAAYRASRKGLRPEDQFSGIESDARFGRYAVRRVGYASERFTTYWK